MSDKQKLWAIDETIRTLETLIQEAYDLKHYMRLNAEQNEWLELANDISKASDIICSTVFDLTGEQLEETE
jgi:hypothetical protein